MVATGVAAALAAQAQESAAGLETVTVTARKQVENLQEVPIAITAFSAEAIERKGLANIADVARLTPGLTFDVGLVPNDTRPALRGLQALRGRPNVAMLVDGVDVTSETSFVAGGGTLLNLRLVDVERIEVVKGPQNVLYGRSAMSGAINYISKRPDFDGAADAAIEIGSEGTYGVKGSVSGALIDDVLAVRLQANSWSTDGWAQNPNTGGELGEGDVKGIALSGIWKPAENFDAYARVSYSEEEYGPAPRTYISAADPAGLPNTAQGGVLLPDPYYSSPPYGQPGGAANADCSPYPLFPGPFAPQVLPIYPNWGKCQYSVVGNLSRGIAKSEKGIDFSPNPLTGQDYFGAETETFRTTLELNWRTGIGTFTSLTGFTTSDNAFDEDFDLTNSSMLGGLYATVPPLPANTLFPGQPALCLPDPTGQFGFPVTGGCPFGEQADSNYTYDTEQFSQEIRYLGESEGGRARWVVDLLYWSEDFESNNGGQFWMREGSTVGFWNFYFRTCPGLFGPGSNPFCGGPGGATSFLPPNWPGLLTAPLEDPPSVAFNRETESWSLGASYEWAFTKDFKVTLEGRYIQDDMDYSGTPCDTVFISTFRLPCVDLQTGQPVGLTRKSVDFSEFTPRLTASWQVTPENLLYATYAQGYKPGGIDSTSTDGDVTKPSKQYDPESLDAYEIGSKNVLFGNRLVLNAALFFNIYTDQQVGTIEVDPNTGFVQARTLNIGESETYGAELEATWLITDHLSAQLAYAYTHAEFTDYTRGVTQGLVRAESGNAECAATNANGSCRLWDVSNDGNQVPRTPENKLAVDLRYQRPVGSGDLAAFGEIGVQFTDDTWVDDQNLAYLPDWWNTDLTVGLQSGSWTVQAYVANVFDDDTIRSSTRNVNYGFLDGSFNPIRGYNLYLTAPRSYGLRASMSF
jgi:iron complex outermembrane recepter protein